MSEKAVALGGPIVDRFTRWLLLVIALGVGLMAWRLLAGLGATTALNDGYPWGLWIAFDVVTGTALACGGYAVALLVYILNKGKYHPMVRPAILTSALGYSLAGLAISLDVGRPWGIWKIPTQVTNWNLNSALLEVALCVMAYTFVLWVEMSPALMERWKGGKDGFLKRVSDVAYPIVDKLLPWIIALGLVLPTMHQSSLGTLMLLTGPKLHPLWHTPLLPLLFLVSCLGMGYAVIVFESSASSLFFKRRRETEMLAGLARTLVPVLFLFSGIRLLDVVLRGRLGLVFAFDRYSFLFLLEMALFLVPAFLLLGERSRRDAGRLFHAAVLMVFAGALYRFDTYLVAFRPGDNWSYFPSVPEMAITLGVVAIEVFLYIAIVRLFPILSGEGKPEAVAAAG